MKEVKIQVASENEEDQIRQLVTTCFSEINNSDISIEQTDTSFSIIAICNQKIIGHIRIDQLKDVFKNKLYYVLNYVCVDPQFRNCGVGTRLLLFVEEMAKAKNVSYIELTSQPTRIAAHHLYQQNHFTIKNTDFFYKHIQ